MNFLSLCRKGNSYKEVIPDVTVRELGIVKRLQASPPRGTPAAVFRCEHFNRLPRESFSVCMRFGATCEVFVLRRKACPAKDFSMCATRRNARRLRWNGAS